MRVILSGVLLLAPLLLWLTYVQVMMGSGGAGIGNFSWPVWGVFQKLDEVVRTLVYVPAVSPIKFAHNVFEVLCPLSLYVQAVYLLKHPRLRVPAWRLGIGFAALLLVLGPSAWADQNAYSRVLLLLTMAFNLLIHQHEQGRLYLIWYAAGNAGMAWMLVKTTSILHLAIWL